MHKRNQIISTNTEEDLNTFKKLFLLYYPRLKNYASCLLRSEEEAEDLVQDVFTQVWKNRAGLDGEKNVGTYLFTLIRNRCLNLIKHKIVEEKYLLYAAKNETEELYHISFAEKGEFISMEDQLTAELELIISKMPAKCQTAFRLKWFEKKKIREIAEIMKISTTMVDKHLQKGLTIARESLLVSYQSAKN